MNESESMVVDVDELEERIKAHSKTVHPGPFDPKVMEWVNEENWIKDHMKKVEIHNTLATLMLNDYFTVVNTGWLVGVGMLNGLNSKEQFPDLPTAVKKWNKTIRRWNSQERKFQGHTDKADNLKKYKIIGKGKIYGEQELIDSGFTIPNYLYCK